MWAWPSSPCPGLDRATLEPILTYCAEQRCEADDATCPGCRLRTEKLGIQSLRRLRRPPRRDPPRRARGIRLPGHGTSTLRRRSLEHLAKTWAGEEYWFWARRVLRKLRHGIRRAGQSGGPDADGRRYAGRHPGAPAARRQHRHGGARHGQLRPRGPAPGRPARRLAQREGAHCRLRCQLHHRWRAGLRHARRRRSTGLNWVVRHHRAPARPRQAGADAGAGGGRDAAARSPTGSAAASCSGRSATAWRPTRSPTPTPS